MTKSLADVLNSPNSSVKPGKIACAEEIFRLHKENDPEGMKNFAETFQNYLLNGGIDPSFEEGYKQAALRNLDEASYIADIISEGINNKKDILDRAAKELSNTPQHLWEVGEIRKFYQNSTNYSSPFGMQGFYNLLDHSVYSMFLNQESRVWLVLNKFTLSEDHAIDYLKNKIVELENAVTKILSEGEDIKKLKFDETTKLEKLILTLPEKIRKKIVGGYEDCIGVVRKNIEVPKEPADYISVQMGVVPSDIVNTTIPEARDSKWYSYMMNHFILTTGSEDWHNVVPFEQLSEQEPQAKIKGISRDKRWYIHQAAVETYSFFSDQENFAKLDNDQSLIPEQCLLGPVQALHS